MNPPPLRLLHCEPFDIREGGMAHVYLCRGTGPYEERVAVKRLKPEYASMPAIAQHFLRECHIWMQLGEHRNVVRAVSAHMASPEPPMVVLEYVSSSLRDYLGGEPLELETALSFFADICDGMDFVARRVSGFVHRDLKPENILVEESAVAKITDFGLALVKEIFSSANDRGFAGTPMYAAPEQAQGVGVSVKTDIYAAGCVLYEMLAGRPLFGFGKTRQDYLRCHVKEAPVDLREIRSDLPGRLLSLVHNCLAKAPENRYASFKELRSDLERCASELAFDLPPATEGEVRTHELYNSCQGLLNLGLREDAMKVAKEIVELEPKSLVSSMARLVQARIHGEEGRLTDASHVLREAKNEILSCEQDQIIAMYYTESARIADGLGRVEEAVRHSEKAAELMPDGSVGWHNLAHVYVSAGRIDDAIDAEKKAIHISTDYRYYSTLADILSDHKEDYAGALAVLEQAIGMHSHLHQPYMQYASTALLRIQQILQDAPSDLNRLPQVYAAARRSLVSASRLGAPRDAVGAIDDVLNQIGSLLQIQ